MNLNTLTGSRGLYYSSIHGEGENKGFQPSPTAKLTTTKSPMNRKEYESKSHPSSIPDAVTTTIHSASMKMKNTARTLTPKRLPLSPCLPRAPTKPRRRLEHDSYQDDDMTPVIFYADEDALPMKCPSSTVWRWKRGASGAEEGDDEAALSHVGGGNGFVRRRGGKLRVGDLQ